MSNIRAILTGFGIFSLSLSGVASAETITVKRGDTLSKLAQEHLGSLDAWEELCEANRDTIGRSCNRIYPGMVLTLPGSEPAAETETASEPAEQDAAEAPAATPEPAPAPAPEAAPETADAGEPAPTYVEGSGKYVLDFADQSEQMFSAPDGYRADRPQGEAYEVLAGSESPMPASTGKPGIWVRLDGFEVDASGKTVKVDVTVAGDPGSKIAVAYSTSDVGNSGWKMFDLTGGQQTVSFDYNVPELKNGNGDFIGILPDPDGTGQSLRVYKVMATVSDS